MTSYNSMTDAQKKEYIKNSIKNREEMSKIKNEQKRFLYMCDECVKNNNQSQEKE